MVGLRGPKYLLFARKCLSEEIQKLLGFREGPRVGSEVGTILNFSNNGAGASQRHWNYFSGAARKC